MKDARRLAEDLDRFEIKKIRVASGELTTRKKLSIARVNAEIRAIKAELEARIARAENDLFQVWSTTGTMIAYRLPPVPVSILDGVGSSSCDIDAHRRFWSCCVPEENQYGVHGLIADAKRAARTLAIWSLWLPESWE